MAKTKPPGAKTWKELAALPDQTVLSYFLTVEGCDERHAKNRLKLLREVYKWSDEKQEFVRVPGAFQGRRNANNWAPRGDSIDYVKERNDYLNDYAPKLENIDLSEFRKAPTCHGCGCELTSPYYEASDGRKFHAIECAAQFWDKNKELRTWNEGEPRVNPADHLKRVPAEVKPEPVYTAPEPKAEAEAPKAEAPKADPIKFKAPQLNAADPMQAMAAALLPIMGPILAQAMAKTVDATISAALKAYTPPEPKNDGKPREVVHTITINEPKQAPRTLDGLHHKSAAKVVALAAQGETVLMSGPAGCGKTSIGHSVAKAFKKTLTLISCSAGMTEAQLMGRLLPMGKGGAFVYVESPFVKAYREGGVILLDEIDAADANLLLAINAALANGQMEIEARAASGLETTVVRHPETIILAAANTWGTGADTQYVGRAALDAATLDRFYPLAVDYCPDLERAICPDAVTLEAITTLRSKARVNKLRRVVSTRMLAKVTRGLAAGLPRNEVMADLLASWTADERAKVGA